MISLESLIDRLAPLGVDAREKEFLVNATPVLGTLAPATVVALALQVREVRGALRADSKLVRFLLLADLLADAGIIGYAMGKARQLKKTETEEQRTARLAEVRPVTWKTYVVPLRTALAVGLATSTNRSRGQAVRSALLTYGFSMAMARVSRALKPRMVRCSELSAEFRAEREALAKSPEDRVREITERLEQIGGQAGTP